METKPEFFWLTSGIPECGAPHARYAGIRCSLPRGHGQMTAYYWASYRQHYAPIDTAVAASINRDGGSVTVVSRVSWSDEE